MKPPSLKVLVGFLPPELRKFVRKRVLPARIAKRLSRKLANEKTAHCKVRRVEVKPQSVRWYEYRLWGGFSEDSLAGLHRIKTSPKSSRSTVANAARALAAWYASQGDLDRAYPEIVLARLADIKLRDRKVHTFIETDCLLTRGDSEGAATIVDSALADSPEDACYLLTKANTFLGADNRGLPDADGKRLDLVNRIYLNAQLVPLKLKHPERPLSIDNVMGVAPPSSVPLAAQPRVSVLMAAYNCADTLRTAVESLLAQSWTNLEILIVDDVSSDGTYELAERMSQQDTRVSVFRAPANRGAYAARNQALRHATGEFVTLHDTDDWSHPQKIEVQVQHLLDNPELPANCSDWVRCHSDLRFRSTARVRSRRVHMNYSSILVRRSTVLSLGGWDEVRAAGDNEFLRRLGRAHDMSRMPRAAQGVPLAFALEQPGSLTRSRASHILTVFHGVRRTYQEAANYWLDTSGSRHGYRLKPPIEGRTFPAPCELTEGSRERYDLLVIMDYGLRGGAFVSTLNYIQAAVKLGKRVAVFHWRRYDLDPNDGPGPKVLELAQQGAIYVLPPGGRIEVKTVLVGYPPVLNSIIDLPPDIRPESVFVITNQMHARLYSGQDVQYDPSRVSENIVRLFGVTPTWIPISDLVRKLMIADGRYTPIHSSTWTPLIQTDAWCKEKVTYRGGARARPTIGRHARDHYTKWPGAADAIRAAYCADRKATVRLLGGASVPHRILGRLPENWNVLPFGSMEAREFLPDLDFYVHYPNEEYIEEFGRAVLEAMAAGVPVVLPSVFQPTFGTAALYASPSEVWPTIERIWNDGKSWDERSQAGRQFVLQNSDWIQLRNRLEELDTRSESIDPQT